MACNRRRCSNHRNLGPNYRQGVENSLRATNKTFVPLLSVNGRWLASASKDRTVKLWELSTGREVQTLTGHQNSVTSLAFSPNSRWLATSGWDKTVRIWDVATGRQVQETTGYPHPIYALAFDSRGGWLATGSADGTIKLWRLRREIDLAVLGEQNGVRAISSTPSVGAAK